MKPIARVGASFSIGMFASTLTVNESPDYILKANVAPVWQFEIEVKMPRLSDRFTIAVGFQPVKSTYRGTTSVTSSTQTRVDDMTLKPHYVKIPASLKYNFGNPENSFFVRAGGWIGILNREKSTFTSRRSFISGSDVQISDNDMSYFYRFRSPGGAWMGVGYDQSIARRLRIFGEFRYETNGGFIGTDAVPESRFNFINLMVGIGF